MPCGIGIIQQIRTCSEAGLGAFQYRLACQRLQVQHLCGRQNHEELTTLPRSIL
jgi:hypothetical protein